MKKGTLILLALSFIAACNYNVQNEKDIVDYTAKGDSLVKITFDTLRSTLVKTIGGKGLAGALRFCNTEALALTSLYASGDVTITRVSDKSRNPKNELSVLDKEQWDKYKTLVAKNDSVKPIIVIQNKEVNYYKPITMQGMCLNCHGTPKKEIPENLLAVIDSLYPADKATEYKIGDLRGMWHVVFKQKD